MWAKPNNIKICVDGNELELEKYVDPAVHSTQILRDEEPPAEEGNWANDLSTCNGEPPAEEENLTNDLSSNEEENEDLEPRRSERLKNRFLQYISGYSAIVDEPSSYAEINSRSEKDDWM